MYFAMDEIGLENTEKIKLMDKESERWKFIYEVAKEYGFHGIHFTPSLYKELIRIIYIICRKKGPSMGLGNNGTFVL